ARPPARRRGDRRLRPQRLPPGRRLLGAGRGRAHGRPRARRADRRGRRPPRPEGRRVPRLVRPLADVPSSQSMTEERRTDPMLRAAQAAPESAAGWNTQQLAAVEARGRVIVSAGAGTGKTAVLVERFVRAVCADGLDVESVLVITYTRKAAAELRTRARAALGARGRHDLARRLDGAWISTIHGFCNRLLKAHPFAAGLDPRFRELDEAQAAVLRSEAFDEALAEFCADDDPARLRLLVAYGRSRLRTMLIGIYETLRAAGRPLVLELGEAAPL